MSGTPILIPVDIQEILAVNVATPDSGYIAVFADGGRLKQKDSTGVVKDLTATTPVGLWEDESNPDGNFLWQGVAQNFFIQDTQPDVTIPSLWIDTSGGNFQFKYVTP